MNSLPQICLTLTLMLFCVSRSATGRDARHLPATAPQPGRETAEQGRKRHERVGERRSGIMVICHRGAAEFAHENTLEAYRAAFELGADGNEIDIRETRDGVLVCFHDDMLDRLTSGWGALEDLTWSELQQLELTNPGRFGPQSRIPRLCEVLELHRQYAGLLHLDIKRPGLDRKISAMLDDYDLWDHVPFCNGDNGGVILRDPRYRPGRYKASLYDDRSEVFPAAIDAALKRQGDGVIVDDPRAVVLALGRSFDTLSQEPVAPQDHPTVNRPAVPREPELLLLLSDSSDWSRVAETSREQSESAGKIRSRAAAAREIGRLEVLSESAQRLLEDRVRNRSLHRHWMWHGLDGASALQTLLRHHAPGSVELARYVLWRDDPALEQVMNPEFKTPRSWTDFRIKMVVFPAIASNPVNAADVVCRDYLRLTRDEARKLAPEQFREATEALLAISPTTETARELLQHPLQEVRGQAILICLRNSQAEWATAALQREAPHALRYIVAGWNGKDVGR